jgi:CHAD domain-containing protein
MDPEASVRANARPALQSRLDEAVALAALCTGPDESLAMHNLRIALKRLRYTLEVFASSVEGAEALLSTLKRLQDLLGELHDADVLIPLLAPDLAAPGVHALLRRTMADRESLYRDFEETWRAETSAGLPQRILDAIREDAA